MKFNDARLKKSNNAILEAALLTLTENPDTPFTDIAKLAGVGRATLYRLYPNRESLLEALLIRCLTEIDNKLLKAESKARSTKHFFELLFETMLHLEKEYKLMCQFEPEKYPSEKIKALYSRQESEMIDLIRLAQKEGLIDNTLPEIWVARLIDGIIYAVWEFNRTEKDIKQSVKLATKALFNGIQDSSPSLFDRIR
ncbi:TetR/AcrR family transcriptional regulator [Vibrio salinus]|uniref:TetR/AcrR family transcriptional regulator n=1 Tax=Vibrio salinus TaxID=2899784 RepID=UPI001E464730|nr:TetR/AcrR family transcriptional regulator [Vibrio salinus]MCE0494484.1 TetR/AcrR family transcriptional regulator [Vibrio salinus]